jgi:hypothetical protein
MQMQKSSIVSLLVVAITVSITSQTVYADSTTIPCLNTKTDIQLEIQPAGPTDLPLQRVYGTLTSWDPGTTTIGFKSDLSNSVEQIPVRIIRFSRSIFSMIAQHATPMHWKIGRIKRSYAAADFTVKDGVLKFDECVLEHDGHPVAFEGSVTFKGSEVLLEGDVTEILSPAGEGPSESTMHKGG